MGSITALYAGPTVLLFAGLSVYVSSLRAKHRTVLGDNSERSVMRAVRAQGNCAEYIGILFLMLLLAEMSGGNSFTLHVFGGTILVARALHAYGVLGKRGLTHSIGAAVNYFVLIGLAGYVLYLHFT